MTMSAVILDSDRIPSVTRAFVALKCKHFPAKFAGVRSLDLILTEVKGSQILSMTRSSDRNQRRQAMMFRRELLTILSSHGASIMGRIWVKDNGQTLSLRSTYGYAVQDFTQHFNRFLKINDDHGIVIADSRDHGSNLQVAHSIFTQKWKSGGDPYPRVKEVPIFAASDNHAGLQIADLVASTMLLPMATAAFAPARTGNPHTPAIYKPVRETIAPLLGPMIFRYKNNRGFWKGGLDIRNMASATPASAMLE